MRALQDSVLLHRPLQTSSWGAACCVWPPPALHLGLSSLRE